MLATDSLTNPHDLEPGTKYSVRFVEGGVADSSNARKSFEDIYRAFTFEKDDQRSREQGREMVALMLIFEKHELPWIWVSSIKALPGKK